jgi:hypothetical protein
MAPNSSADAEATCAICGAFGLVAETAVYLRGPGTVVSRRECSAMLMAVSRIRGVSCVDRGGLTALDPRQGDRVQQVTLLFGQAAPYAVDLMCAQRERQAVPPDRASPADSLGLRYLRPGRTG